MLKVSNVFSNGCLVNATLLSSSIVMSIHCSYLLNDAFSLSAESLETYPSCSMNGPNYYYFLDNTLFSSMNGYATDFESCSEHWVISPCSIMVVMELNFASFFIVNEEIIIYVYNFIYSKQI